MRKTKKMIGDKHRQVLFGSAYYHEYQPSPRLEEDLDLMAAAGFTSIRVGEATWSSWEPEDGRFDLDWMQPVLDGAHERGIHVVFGTPTFAMPMWLVRKYPEVVLQEASGRSMPLGRREEMDYTHPAFLFHAERVIRKVIGRYADHPAVIGYQLHNEPGLFQILNRGAFEEFKDRLRRRFGDVEALNDRWGLTFWSHRLSTWDDLWRPEGNGQPQYDISWRQFQADLTTEFLAWQRGLVEDYAQEHQFITTDLAMDRVALHETEIAETLDVTGANPYYFMQDGLAEPSPDDKRQSWLTRGAWTLQFVADRIYGTKQKPYLIFETNAGPIGGPATNFPAYDGQLIQCAWSFVARGAEMINYWHWQTLHYGTETYWGGVLPHDQQPGRIYREIAELGAQFKAAGDQVVGLSPDSDVALLYSVPSKWGLAYQPHTAVSDSAHHQNNERSYAEITNAFYRGAYDAGCQVHVVHDSQVVKAGEVLQDATEFATRHPVLIVPALYIADEDLLAWLVAYAEAGGHLVLGPRTAIADLDACIRTDAKPAKLTDAAGAGYQEFANLLEPLPVVSENEWISPDAGAIDWIECLIPDGADVLARPDHPHYRQWAAVTSRVHGQGRVTTVGVLPNAALARDVVSWAAGNTSEWDLPGSVRRSSAVNADGQRVHFLFNWSWDTTEITVPHDLIDVIDQSEVNRDTTVTLGPWGTRVLREV